MLDALTLDQLRTFVAVAEAGSFRAGAKRLSRVQSAVSHAIGNLEAELGVILLDRSSHRPTLTSDGRVLLADGRAILQPRLARSCREPRRSCPARLIVVPTALRVCSLHDVKGSHYSGAPFLAIELERRA